MSIRAIGRRSYVGDGAISTPVWIGNYTSIAPGVRMTHRINHPCIGNPLLVSTASAGTIPGYPQVDMRHGITIGSDVWICENVVLMAPITIGHGAIIGAESVVARDVQPYEIVIGNPAQHLRWRFDPEVIDQLLFIKWWEWDDDVVDARLPLMLNVNEMIASEGLSHG